MPLDPSISLDFKTPPPPANPLEMLGQVANLQSAVAAGRTAQQTLAAKQEAGQIVAGAPDTDTAIQQLQSNPNTAAFAPEIAHNLLQNKSAITNIQGAQAGQARDALGNFLSASVGAMRNPDDLRKMADSRLATIPPAQRPQIAKVFNDAISALTDGIDLKTQQGHDIFQNRFLGALLGANVSQSAIDNFIPHAATRMRGNILESGVELPALQGAGFIGSNALSMGSPATMGNVNGALVPLPAVSGDTPVPNLSGNATPSATAGAAAAGGPSPAGEPLMSWTGKPMTIGTSPAAGRGQGLGGMNVLTSQQKVQEDGLSNDFAGKEKDQFESTQASLQGMRMLDNSIDSLAKDGGFLQPGAAGTFRANFANAANTFYTTILGQKEVPFDPGKVASAQELFQQTRRIGTALTPALLGAGHQAAEIIQGVTASVPGIENSFLGAKLELGAMEAAAHRVVDLRNFKAAWAAKNNGQLSGAVEAFNQQSPPQDYANQVLTKYGLTEKGFSSPEAVISAVNNGYISNKRGPVTKEFPKGSPSDASKILQANFPDWRPAVGAANGQ